MEIKVLADRFRIIRSLGHGGMSEVFLARDLLIGGEVALKIIHAHHARNRFVIERFKREVGISRRVRHPGIIRIHDLYERPDEGLLFLSMEYLPGGNLKTRIQLSDALPIREAVSIGIEALSALEAAHEAGIVHRDIKPHNLLFTADGRVKLTDFGLARTAVGEDVFSDTTSAGTPEYCSPEVALGEYADSRSDLYSLGITLFEALTGRLPFSGGDPYLVLKHQADTPAPHPASFRPGIPRELDEIILKALEKDPARRFQTAGEFREALSELRVRSMPIPAGGPVCPVCGEALSYTLPHCFRCGETLLEFTPAAKPHNAYSVVVLGTGAPGDKLSVDDRSRILSLVNREGISAAKLEKKIPRVPFVLMDRLDGPSAETLAGKLEELGIPARAVGRDIRAAKREIGSAMRKKIMALSPRIWAIMFASSGGLYGSIGNIARNDEWWVGILVLFALALGVVPATIAIGMWNAAASIDRKQVKAANRFRASFLPLAHSLTSRVLQGVARSTAGKLDAVTALIEDSGALGDHDREELTAELAASAGAWCELLSRIQEIESILASGAELGERKDETRLAERFTAAGQTREAEKVMKERIELLRLSEDKRELERTRDLLFDSILKFSSSLDRLALSIGRSGTAEASALAKQVRDSIEDAVAGRREVRALEGGG